MVLPISDHGWFSRESPHSKRSSLTQTFLGRISLMPFRLRIGIAVIILQISMKRLPEAKNCLGLTMGSIQTSSIQSTLSPFQLVTQNYGAVLILRAVRNGRMRTQPVAFCSNPLSVQLPCSTKTYGSFLTRGAEILITNAKERLETKYELPVDSPNHPLLNQQVCSINTDFFPDSFFIWFSNRKKVSFGLDEGAYENFTVTLPPMGG